MVFTAYREEFCITIPGFIWMLVIKIKLLMVHTKDLMCVLCIEYQRMYLFVQVCMNVIWSLVRCWYQVSSSFFFHFTFGNRKQEISLSEPWADQFHKTSRPESSSNPPFCFSRARMAGVYHCTWFFMQLWKIWTQVCMADTVMTQPFTAAPRSWI